MPPLTMRKRGLPPFSPNVPLSGNTADCPSRHDPSTPERSVVRLRVGSSFGDAGIRPLDLVATSGRQCGVDRSGQPRTTPDRAIPAEITVGSRGVPHDSGRDGRGEVPECASIAHSADEPATDLLQR